LQQLLLAVLAVKLQPKLVWAGLAALAALSPLLTTQAMYRVTGQWWVEMVVQAVN
jgi:hypothetical protein